MTSNGAKEPAILSGAYKPGPAQREAFSICIYGRGGVGKTTLVGTMPGRGLILDTPKTEGGTFVLENVADRIDIYPLKSWGDIQTAFWFLKKEAHKYQWVAIDSITGVTQLAITKVIGEREIQADPHKISLPEWGIVGRLVGELVPDFRTLPIHTIWVAQERVFGEEGQPKVIGPDTSPAARQMLIPPLLLCGRLYLSYGLDGTQDRVLRILPHPEFDAKARSRPGQTPPAVIKNPNLGVILKYLLGSGERPAEHEEGNVIILS